MYADLRDPSRDPPCIFCHSAFGIRHLAFGIGICMSIFRLACRSLLKARTFTAVALATMALGIAANTAIFSVVNAVLLRPLPFRDEARVAIVATVTADDPKGNHSAGDFLDLQRANRSLAAIAGYRADMVSVSARPGSSMQFEASYVTAGFFDVLGARPAVGRTFTAAQDARGGERLVVLGIQAAEQAYGTAAAAVGQTIRVNGQACTIAGVMPRDFAWPDGARVWILARDPVPPSPIDVPDPLTNREVRYFNAVARLKDGVSLESARADLHSVAQMLAKEHPKTAEGREFRLVPIREELTGDVRRALLVIQGAVGLVLLIVCANVSSLLIARATGRRRELAIRAALGAARGDLIRQLLAESVVLGIAGGAVGLAAGAALVRLLVRLLPEGVPRADVIGLDTTVTLVALAVSVATGIVFGILPAWQASRTNAALALKESGDRGSARAPGRAVLVVAEVALTLVLLVAAGLLGGSFLYLQRVDTGFAPDHVTVADLNVPQTRYPKGANQVRLYGRILEGLSARSEVQAAGVGFPGPLHGGSASGNFFVEGWTIRSTADVPFAYVASVSGGYFAAMGIPRLAGRTFTEADRDEAAKVAIVSASLARRYWPGQDPVGRRVRFGGTEKEPWVTIVGVVADARQLGLREQMPPILYIPYQQFPLPFTTIAIRSSLPTGAVAQLVRAQVASIDADLAVTDVSTLEAVVARSIGEPRFRAALIGAFAALGLLLAAVGVYGLISYSVAQRTREIGIRVALGARPGQILMSALRDGFTLAAAGIAIGLAAALALTRVLSAFLFGIRATDPRMIAGAALVLLAVAIAAAYVPSRRALSVDPLTALRSE